MVQKVWRFRGSGSKLMKGNGRVSVLNVDIITNVRQGAMTPFRDPPFVVHWSIYRKVTPISFFMWLQTN